MVVPRQSLPAGLDYNGVYYADTWVGGAMYNNKDKFGDYSSDDCASGYRKFKWMLDYSNDKMNDDYIGVPYIRLAEMYLIRAEAKAETGNLQGALDDLHVVRSRVGLKRLEDMNPDLNLKSNKENLINEILRERNCEIGAECGDLFSPTLHQRRRRCIPDQDRGRNRRAADRALHGLQLLHALPLWAEHPRHLRLLQQMRHRGQDARWQHRSTRIPGGAETLPHRLRPQHPIATPGQPLHRLPPMRRALPAEDRHPDRAAPHR